MGSTEGGEVSIIDLEVERTTSRPPDITLHVSAHRMPSGRWSHSTVVEVNCDDCSDGRAAAIGLDALYTIAAEEEPELLAVVLAERGEE